MDGVIFYLFSSLQTGSGRWRVADHQSPRTHHTAFDHHQHLHTHQHQHQHQQRHAFSVPQSFLFHTDSNYKQQQQQQQRQHQQQQDGMMRNQLRINMICMASIGLLVLSNSATATASNGRSATAPAFQNFFNNFLPKSSASPNPQQIKLENALLETINGNSKRLDNSKEITSIVEQLEQSNWGIAEPAISPQVKGLWRLLHTNNADTASPIQRKAVDASKYSIYQDIFLRQDDDDDNIDADDVDKNGPTLIVSQVVKFGDKAQLAVDALASTSQYPLEELTTRQRTGKILGANILGVSKVGEDAQEDSSRPNSRIFFVFDEGNFNFNGLKVPYPVPFRWPIFRDAVKGWIDITYLSDRIRISRGNKGTTFVLLKEDEDEDDG